MKMKILALGALPRKKRQKDVESHGMIAKSLDIWYNIISSYCKQTKSFDDLGCCL